MNIDKTFYIEIDGKKVPLRINTFASSIYRRRFRRDLFKTIQRYAVMEEFKLDLKTCNQLAQIVWTFAKTANPKVPSYQKWIDDFEEFPIKEIFPKIVAELTK